MSGGRRRRAAAVLSAALLPLLAGCGGAGWVKGVPIRLQRELATRYGAMAFLPTRLPAGFTWRTVHRNRGGFYLHFQSGSGGFDFGVADGCGPLNFPGMGAMSTTHLNGMIISFSETMTEQAAWGCRSQDGHSYAIAVQGGESSPTVQSDFVNAVAYARSVGG